MKTDNLFLKIDFGIQSLLMFMNTTFMLMLVFEPVIFLFILYLQILIGFYQFVLSATPHIFSNQLSNDIRRLRILHYVASLILLSVTFSTTARFFVSISNILGFITLVGLPQLFAYAYFWITYRDWKARKDYYENRPTIFA